MLVPKIIPFSGLRHPTKNHSGNSQRPCRRPSLASRWDQRPPWAWPTNWRSIKSDTGASRLSSAQQAFVSGFSCRFRICACPPPAPEAPGDWRSALRRNLHAAGL